MKLTADFADTRGCFPIVRLYFIRDIRDIRGFFLRLWAQPALWTNDRMSFESLNLSVPGLTGPDESPRHRFASIALLFREKLIDIGPHSQTSPRRA